jgi:hypothetical protein
VCTRTRGQSSEHLLLYCPPPPPVVTLKHTASPAFEYCVRKTVTMSQWQLCPGDLYFSGAWLAQYSGRAAGWTTGVLFPERVGIYFSLRHRVQTGSEAHAANCPMRESDHSPACSGEVRNFCLELYLHSVIRIHGVLLK